MPPAQCSAQSFTQHRKPLNVKMTRFCSILCSRRRVLVIGGSFSGLAAGRDLANHFLVTIIDAKEPFAETAAWGEGK